MKTVARWLLFVSLSLPIHAEELDRAAGWRMEKIRERFEFWPSSAGSQRGPIPKPFPDIFQIDFVTNITWVDHNNNRNVRHGKDSKFPNETTIPGRLFYDWTNMRQRIDHGPGSYECTHFYEHDGPCSLIFLPDLGMYRILKDHDATTTHNNVRCSCCWCSRILSLLSAPLPVGRHLTGTNTTEQQPHKQ